MLKEFIYWSGSRDSQAEVDPGLDDSGIPIYPLMGNLAYIFVTHNPKRKEYFFTTVLARK